MGGGGDQKQTTNLPSWAQQYSKEGVRGVFDYFFPSGHPSAYGGPNQSVAPLTPDQEAAFAASRKLAGGVGDMYAPYSPEQMNKYLDPYVKRAQESTISQYQDTIAPDILSRAAQTGTLGSTGHALATTGAQSNLVHALGDIDVGIREPAWESAQNRGLQAANAQVQSQLAANQALGSAGSQQQQQGQNVLDTNYNNLNRAWQWPQQAFSQLASDFGGFLGNQSTTRVSGGGK